MTEQMKPPSVVMRLYGIRKQVRVSLAILEDCRQEERASRMSNNPSATGSADAAWPRDDVMRAAVRRWNAEASILRCGFDIFVLSVDLDKARLTVEQKLDLLGGRRRLAILPSNPTFSSLVGSGFECPSNKHGHVVQGVLHLAAAWACAASIRGQHEAARPLVEAYEKRLAEQQNVDRMAGAVGGYVFPAPKGLQ
jgi:hypothetical protein